MSFYRFIIAWFVGVNIWGVWIVDFSCGWV